MSDHKGTNLVGAAEKLALAKRMKQSSRTELAEKSGGGQLYVSSQAIPVTIIFVVAVVLTMMTMEDSGNALLSGLRLTGNYNIDRLLFGPGMPSLAGDGDVNRMIVTLVRGGVFFVAAGILPLIGLLLTIVIGKDRLSPLVAVWGAGVLVPGLYFTLKDVVGPLFKNLTRSLF